MANKKGKSDPATFLANLDRRPLQLKRRTSREEFLLGLEPVGLVLGQGDNALEIAIVSADRKPSELEARRVLEELQDGRNVPFMAVFLYNDRAMTCGPVGDFSPAIRIPVVLTDRKPAQVERLCRAALEFRDGNEAAHFIWHQLSTLKIMMNKFPQAEVLDKNKNFIRIDWGSVTTWWVFDTLVAFRVGACLVVRENEWGWRNEELLDMIDGGAWEQRLTRVNFETFERLWRRLVSPPGRSWFYVLHRRKKETR